MEVRIDAYAYQLLDRQEVEIISCHWHPAGAQRRYLAPPPSRSSRRRPPAGLLGAHLPTGWVALEQVVRLAVMDLGIQARRSDWPEVIRESQETFERWPSWP